METWEEFAKRGVAGLKAEGALSDWIDEAVTFYRKANADWVEFARDLNRLAHRFMLDHEHVTSECSSHDAKSFGYRLLLRSINCFQAAVILAERGMAREADMQTRGNYEAAFWMGYFSADAKAAEQGFLADEVKSQIGLLKAQREAQLKEGNLDAVKYIDEHLKGLPKGNPPSMAELAKKAGLERAYVTYRFLSGSSGHTSVHSLHHFIRSSENKKYAGHRHGPDATRISSSLQLACESLFLNLFGFSELVGETDYDKEVEDMFFRSVKLDRPSFEFGTKEEQALYE